MLLPGMRVTVVFPPYFVPGLMLDVVPAALVPIKGTSGRANERSMASGP
jgi:hypothetical protein